VLNDDGSVQRRTNRVGTVKQARITRGTQGPKPPRANFSTSLETCVGHSLKLLDIFQIIWDPL